ncbi:RND transporter [Synergistales bacterium]|nr:RND transporter [Synergistales bacterium]
MFQSILRKLNGLRVLFWLAVIGVGVWILATEVQAKLKESAANVASLAENIVTIFPVTSDVVAPELWESWRSYYGQAKAARTQDVTAYVREVVQSVHVQVGDSVKSGQTVVSLLKADYAANAQASRTGYEEALLNYNRLSELSKKGGVSQSEVDRAYAAMKSLEASAQSSRSTLQRTELKASINGIVSARSVEPGEVAEVGKPLISIIDPSEMEAQLMVSKKDIPHINKNTSVVLMVDGKRSNGRVKRISPEAHAGSGLYAVIVGVASDSGILPGAYLEGQFLVEKKDSAIIIPSDIVMYRGDKQFVYTLKDSPDGSVAQLVTVVTSEGRNGRVIVEDGLKLGDRIIVSGNRTLSDGARVEETAK